MVNEAAAAAVGSGSVNPCFGFLWGLLGFLRLQCIQPGATSCLDTLDNKNCYIFWAKPIFLYQIALNICLCFVNDHDYFVLIQLITFPAKITKGYFILLIEC